MGKPRIGAQLYTVREHCKDMPSIVETLGKVRDIGYTEVQISGFGPVDPAEVAKAVEDAGLKVVSSHGKWNDFLDDLDAVIEKHRLWGCAHPAIGSLGSEYFSLEGLQRFADELGPVAERLAAAGMDFSYHNHNHELARFEGRTWLARLYGTIPGDVLKAEIDTYWIVAGGGDPVRWIRELAGRQPLLHLKDMCVTQKREQRFAPVGEGNLNWPEILKAAEESGVEHLLVEQDTAYGNDPFGELATSYRNLRALGYE